MDKTLTIISRKESKILKLKRFYTGIECNSNHLSERSTNNGSCLECIRIRKKTYRKNNSQKIQKSNKAYQKANRESIAKREKIYAKNNSEAISKRKRVYRESNSKDISESGKLWKKNNKGLCRSYDSTRRSLLLNATPSWSNKSKIADIYKKAREMEIKDSVKYHVDHIIPLNSNLVCGLHTEDNLQILTAKQNLEKSNIFNQVNQ